jgi:hypothetical protein
MYIVTNALSLNMLGANDTVLRIQERTLNEVRVLLSGAPHESAIGHQDTATLYSRMLGIDLPYARTTVRLDTMDLIVGQYSGPRLPEGATVLPEGATIKWYLVRSMPEETELLHQEVDA